MTLDSKGRLTVAGHAARNIWRLESLSPLASKTILADTYQGKRLNSPNDLVYRSDGSLYFTDPPYGLRTQDEKDPAIELPMQRCLPHPRRREPEARHSAGPCSASASHQGPSASQRHRLLARRKISSTLLTPFQKSGCAIP